MSNADTQITQLSNKQLMLLSIAMYCINMGQTLIFAILPALGREVGLREFQINSIISLSALFFSFMSSRWGRKSDHWGRKPVILLGLFGYGVGNALFGFGFYLGLNAVFTGTTLFVVIIVLRLCQSIVMSATSPAISAYIADNTSSNMRSKSYAKVGAANNLGTITGPIVAGIFVSFSLLAPMVVASLATIAAGVWVALYLPESNVMKDSQHRTKLRYNDRRYRHFIIATFGVFLCFSSIQQTIGFTLQDSLGLDSAQTVIYTGTVLMISAICSVFAQMVLVQRWKLSPPQFIRRGTSAILAGMLVLLIMENLMGIVVGIGLMGVGLGLTMPNVFSGASLAVSPHDQGAISGLVASVPSMGFILGPVIAGSLYEIAPSYPHWFATLVIATTACWLWWKRH